VALTWQRFETFRLGRSGVRTCEPTVLSVGDQRQQRRSAEPTNSRALTTSFSRVVPSQARVHAHMSESSSRQITPVGRQETWVPPLGNCGDVGTGPNVASAHGRNTHKVTLQANRPVGFVCTYSLRPSESTSLVSPFARPGSVLTTNCM